MSNLTVSTLVDTFMESADLPAAQTTLGIASQLPQWMFDAADSSAPDPGCFTTNSASLISTTLIYLALAPKGGGDTTYIAYIAAAALDSWIVLLGPNGKTYGFDVTATALTGFGVQLTVGIGMGGSDTWAGLYSLSHSPSMGNVNLPNILTNASITPCPDGTVTPVTSITTKGGIITAIS